MSYHRIVFNLEGGIRREKLHGRSHLVVPAAMLAEAVVPGSGGPIFYPGEELQKSVPLWNHKPVVVYHPDNNGTPISACSPEVLDSRGIGILLNTKYDDKLRAECWLDEERVRTVDNRILTALEGNSKVEVSTGLFLDEEPTKGVWNNTEYTGVGRNYKPDHLAALPDKTGAYSVAMGGGMLTINQAPEAERTQAALNRSLTAALKPLGVVQTNNELSFGDVTRQLSDLLAAKYGEPGKYWPGYVKEVYNNYCIFCKSYDDYNRPMWMIDYKKKGDTVSLAGEAVEVVLKTEYEAVANQATFVVNGDGELVPKTEVKPMAFDKAKHINDLIANGVWPESDRGWLNTLDDTKLERFKVPATATLPITAPTVNQTPAPVVSVEQYIANAPAEIRPTFQRLIDWEKVEKEKVVVNILANPNNRFNPEYLRHPNRTLEELQGMAALAGPTPSQNPPMFTNYGGAGGAPPTTNAGPNNQPTLPAPEIDFAPAFKN